MRKTLLIWGLIFALKPAIVRAADPSEYGIPVPPPIPPGVSAPYARGPDLCVPPDLQEHLTELLIWTKNYPQLCADIMAAREKHADQILANRAAEHDAEIAKVKSQIPRWWVLPAAVIGAAAIGYAAGKILP